jgi:hypothetical protein
MLFFRNGSSRQSCIDATEPLLEYGIARYINHSRILPNLMLHKLWVGKELHICMFALTDIQPTQELLFDYNDRRSTIAKSCPWIRS